MKREMKAVEGWITKRFDEIGTIFSGSTPSTSVRSFWNGEIVWVTPNDLSKLNTHYLSDSDKRITVKGLDGCSAHLLPAGSIVMSSRAPIGYVAIPTVEFCTNQGCKSIHLKENFTTEFTYYNILFNIDKVKNLGEGTTFAEISKTALSTVELAFPSSKPEQTKIAEILSTVDRAIEQTEALIAKQQRIKTGLMQDLLTRGIDEHGNLRTEQTHQFKDSPLGRIPVEWEVNTIGEIVQEAILGITFRGIRTDNVCPLIKMGNLSWGSLNLDTVEIVDQERDGSDAPQLEYRDFLFNTRNTPELVGKTVVWRSEINRATFDNNLLRLRFHESVASPFLNFYMSFGKGKDEVRALVTGTTSVAAIYWRNLKSYPFPRPPIAEQERTIKVVEDTLRVLDATRAKLHKLRSLKTALMQDLLTGKKRITDLLDDTEVTVL